MVTSGLISPLDMTAFLVCDSAQKGKWYGAKEVLDLVHTDLCGPMSASARGGYEYFITFVDDYSRYGYIYLMRHKSEAFDKFKEFKTEVENHRDKSIKSTI